LILTLKSKQYAYDLCKDIDLKDITYLALSIELEIPLITRDELLLKGLQRKGYKQFISFNDFVGSI
jgi:predicted nucleic acid-binding protein